jgi:hypothetical protein
VAQAAALGDYADMGQMSLSSAQTIALLVGVVLPVFAESMQYRYVCAVYDVCI